MRPKHLLILFFGILVLISCSKDNNDTGATPKPVAKTKTEILTYKPWIIVEEYDLENNTLGHYERGKPGNTTNFDNEELTFQTNNKGSFKDIFGSTYPIDWAFTNPEQTKMNVTIHFPSSNPVLNYNMVQLSDSSFSTTFSQVNSVNGNNVLVSVRRVWKP